MAIEAKLSINNEEFKKGLKDAENQASKSMKKMGDASSGAGASISKVSTAIQGVAGASGGLGKVTGILSKMGPYGMAAAAAIAVIGTAIFGVFKAINTLTSGLDRIAKSAKSVNMSANAYLSLQHACNRAGLEMEKVLGIINKIDYAVNHAQDGNKKYREAFYSIGLSWRDLEKLSPEKRLMAINDALSRLKSQGKNMPTEMFNVLGRKDMETLNKMTAEKEFNKFVAEAGALGFTVPQSMIDAAESYQDAMSDTQAKLKAMIASMKGMEEITEGLTWMWKKISDSVGKANGFVDKEYSDRFEGIGNVTEDLFKNRSDMLSNHDKQKILASLYSSNMPNNVNDEFGGDFYKYLDFVKNLDPKALEKEFQTQIRKVDFKKLPNAFWQPMLKYAEQYDDRFKVNDKSTWVQAKKESYQSKEDKRQAIAKSKAADEADYVLKQLQETQEYYENLQNKKGKLIDIDAEILKIEKKLKKELGDQNAELDKEVKHQLQMNAALANAKALQNEMLNLKEKGNQSFNSFYSEMLGQMGANKNMVDQYLETMANLTRKY